MPGRGHAVTGLGHAASWTTPVAQSKGEVPMRPVRIISAVIFVAAVAVTGCTTHATTDQPSAAAAPAAHPAAKSVRRTLTSPPVTSVTPIVRSPRPTPTPTPPAPGSLHFATPQASMRYLAAAYNANDLASLMHVTTPAARHNLLFMRANAPNLQLVNCTANAGAGDYTCAFTHDFPVASHRSGHGQAHFTVAPADRPGWYMTVLEDCD
jgi:hypothetical protein